MREGQGLHREFRPPASTHIKASLELRIAMEKRLPPVVERRNNGTYRLVNPVTGNEDKWSANVRTFCHGLERFYNFSHPTITSFMNQLFNRTEDPHTPNAVEQVIKNTAGNERTPSHAEFNAFVVRTFGPEMLDILNPTTLRPAPVRIRWHSISDDVVTALLYHVPRCEDSDIRRALEIVHKHAIPHDKFRTQYSHLLSGNSDERFARARKAIEWRIKDRKEDIADTIQRETGLGIQELIDIVVPDNE